jgi:hypothetical protein
MTPETHAMNTLRSEWAGAALASFSEQTGCDGGIDAIHDLIADLGHFAELEGYDFHDIVERAVGTWLLERSGLEASAKAPVMRLTEIGGAS